MIDQLADAGVKMNVARSSEEVPRVFEGKQFLSIKNFQEYDCKRSRRRMLAATAYSGHLGKGAVVGSEFFATPSPWEGVGAGGYPEYFLKLACGKK